MKRRAQNDPGLFAILVVLSACVVAVGALPWIVEHGAGFIDAARTILVVVVAVGVCLFLALGGHIIGSLSDRTSRGGAMDPSPRAPRRRSVR